MLSRLASKRFLIAAAVIVACGIVWMIERRPHAPVPPASPPAPPGENHEPRRMALEGVLACLPPMSEMPSIESCRLGLRAADGSLYALDFALMSSMPVPHREGDRVSGAGLFTPVERLSADVWRLSGVEGIFSVTDSFTVIESASS